MWRMLEDVLDSDKYTSGGFGGGVSEVVRQLAYVMVAWIVCFGYCV